MLNSLFFSLFSLVSSAQAEPNWAIHCDYSYDQMPTSSVELSLLPDGHFGNSARISMQGQIHFESFTEEAAAAGERVHGWLSKESQDNQIEVVVYLQPTAQGQSKMTNHHVPFAQDMWGTCKFTASAPLR